VELDKAFDNLLSPFGLFTSLDFAADRSRLFVGAGCRLYVVDAATGQIEAATTFVGPDDELEVCFDPSHQEIRVLEVQECAAGVCCVRLTSATANAAWLPGRCPSDGPRSRRDPAGRPGKYGPRRRPRPAHRATSHPDTLRSRRWSMVSVQRRWSTLFIAATRPASRGPKALSPSGNLLAYTVDTTLVIDSTAPAA
jgi:hypothetical protein